MGDLSRHFSLGEFACRCGCGLALADPSLVTLLEKIREKMGRPIIITSGVRCERHNRFVGGSENSSHKSGHGADLHAPGGINRFQLVMASLEAGTMRIGIGDDFIHLDTSPLLPSPRLWSYKR